MDTQIQVDNKNIVNLKSSKSAKPKFNWEDPLLLETLFSEEEIKLILYPLFFKRSAKAIIRIK